MRRLRILTGGRVCAHVHLGGGDPLHHGGEIDLVVGTAVTARPRLAVKVPPDVPQASSVPTGIERV